MSHIWLKFKESENWTDSAAITPVVLDVTVIAPVLRDNFELVFNQYHLAFNGQFLFISISQLEIKFCTILYPCGVLCQTSVITYRMSCCYRNLFALKLWIERLRFISKETFFATEVFSEIQTSSKKYSVLGKFGVININFNLVVSATY